MISFRPHTLTLTVSGHGYQREDGVYVPGKDVVISGIPCRYEPNGRAATIALEDGTIYTYSYMVYLGVDCPEISFGDTVELFNQKGGTIGQFTCHGFHRGQLNSRLWV